MTRRDPCPSPPRCDLLAVRRLDLHPLTRAGIPVHVTSEGCNNSKSGRGVIFQPRLSREYATKQAEITPSLVGIGVCVMNSKGRYHAHALVAFLTAHPSRSLLPSLAGASFASRGTRGRRGSPLYQICLGQPRRPSDACEPGPAGARKAPPPGQNSGDQSGTARAASVYM